MRRAVLAALFACCFAAAPARGQSVELALVLAIDVSSSVDFEEYRLQMAGYAAAFRDRRLVDALAAAGPDGLAVTVVQWAGPGQHYVSVPWTTIGGSDHAEAVAVRLETAPRAFPTGVTDIAGALGFAGDLFGAAPFEARRRTIDLSGDGRANAGGRPQPASAALAARGITVNGLAILTDDPTLDGYYADNVIAGPAAFVRTAAGYEDLADAVLDKIVTEIRGNRIAVRDAPDEPD